MPETEMRCTETTVGRLRGLCAALGSGDDPVGGLSGDELLALATTVERMSRLVSALQVQVAARIDGDKLAAAKGMTSTAALLCQLLMITPEDARSRVRLGAVIIPRQALSGELLDPVLPLLADAVAAGAIGAAQAVTTETTMRRLPPAVSAQSRELCEELLVDNGIQTPAQDFVRFARWIETRADPDGSLDEREPAEKAEFTIGRRDQRTGLTPFWGKLDDIGIELVRAAIDDRSRPRPDCADTPDAGTDTGSADGARRGDAGGGGADFPTDRGAAAAAGAGAGAGGGGDGDGDADCGAGSAGPSDVLDARSPACRRAQALVEALGHGLNAGRGPLNHGVRPHLVVTVDFDALTQAFHNARFGSGMPVSPSALRMLLCDAEILPVVLGGGAQILDVGQALRSFTPAMRAAIVARDRGCAFPGCDRPPGWCQTHHVKWFGRDRGPTAASNGALLCQWHHTKVHTGGWQMRIATDGRPEFLPPTWVDPDQRWRRNTSRHLEPDLHRVGFGTAMRPPQGSERRAAPRTGPPGPGTPADPGEAA